MFDIRMDRQVIFAIKVILWNLVGGAAAYLGAKSGNIGRLAVFLILLVVYMIVFLALESREQQVWFLLLSIWQYTLMMETIYRLERYPGTPFETYYIFDILGLIFTGLMFREYYRDFLSDKLLVLLFAFLTFGTVSSIVNVSSGMDWMNAVKLGVRYLGLYLFFGHTRFELPKWGRYFLYASLAAFALEVALGVNVDFRNGLFGYEYTGELFPTLLVIWSAGCLIAVMEQKGRMKYFLIQLVLVELMLILMEAKTEVIVYAAWCFAVLVVKRSRPGDLKKIVMAAIVVAGLFLAWNMLLRFYPNFLSYLGNGVADAIQKRINSKVKKNGGMLELFQANEISYGWQWYLGIGMGASLPPRYVRWVMNTGLDASGLFNIIQFSDIYTKYPMAYQFYNCALNSLRLDLGYVGTVLFYAMIAAAAYRALYICRYGEHFSSTVGAVGMWGIITMVYRTVNANILPQHLPMAVQFALFGTVFYEYGKLKQKRKMERMTKIL